MENSELIAALMDLTKAVKSNSESIGLVQEALKINNQTLLTIITILGNDQKYLERIYNKLA